MAEPSKLIVDYYQQDPQPDLSTVSSDERYVGAIVKATEGLYYQGKGWFADVWSASALRIDTVTTGSADAITFSSLTRMANNKPTTTCKRSRTQAAGTKPTSGPSSMSSRDRIRTPTARRRAQVIDCTTASRTVLRRRPDGK